MESDFHCNQQYSTKVVLTSAHNWFSLCAFMYICMFVLVNLSLESEEAGLFSI